MQINSTRKWHRESQTSNRICKNWGNNQRSRMTMREGTIMDSIPRLRRPGLKAIIGFAVLYRLQNDGIKVYFGLFRSERSLRVTQFKYFFHGEVRVLDDFLVVIALRPQQQERVVFFGVLLLRVPTVLTRFFGNFDAYDVRGCIRS